MRRSERRIGLVGGGGVAADWLAEGLRGAGRREGERAKSQIEDAEAARNRRRHSHRQAFPKYPDNPESSNSDAHQCD
jgi:hypothetical protein